MIDLEFPASIERFRVNPDDFAPNEKRKSIEGGYGLVFFKTQKKTHINVVVKRTKYPLGSDPLFLRSFKREVELLATSDHPAIVPFIGFSQDETYGYIYLYEIENGSLYSFLQNASRGFRDKRLDDHKKFIIAYGVALVLKHLHGMKRIHRDLKPDNILLDNDFHPYVADFGTAKEVDPGIPINQTLAETTAYIMAPEFMEDPLFYSNTPELDVYAYGMTLYELWTEIHPFNNVKSQYRIYQDILHGVRPKIPNSLPEKWKDLIEHCWDSNRLRRPTFEQIVQYYESKEFLTDDEDIKVLKEYKDFLRDTKIKDKIQTSRPNILSTSYRVSPVLAKMRKEAESGDITAQYNYIISQFEGTYGEPDYDEVIEFSTKYANRPGSTQKEFLNDTATIEYCSGKSYLMKGNYQFAQNMLNRASNHGNGDAAYELGNLIYNKKIRGTKRDLEKYFKIAADYGNPDGLKIYAYMLYSGYFNRPDKKRAIQYFKIGSDNGDPELMYMWALRNEYGRDIDKNIKEAMRLMKLSAENGYSPAMVDYGLHLLNGLNVPKNKDRATELFREAALEKKNPEALLWYSVLLMKNPDIDDENDPTTLLKRCINTKEVPEALAVFGRLLAKDKKYPEALQNLYNASQYGSFDALLCLGQLCEKDPKIGKASYFYELAANCCHCLDTLGFFTPIEYNIFHCDKCNIDICEGCAKHCHKGHKVKEIGKQSGFKCQCGQHGFEDKCSGEFVGETYCYQHLYQCSTCCMTTDKYYICKNCAEKCHKGHAITDCGLQRNFCSCGMQGLPHKFKCHLLQYNNSGSLNSCSNVDDKEIKQRWFHCISCNLYGSDDVGICEKCAECCHKDHTIIDLGVKEKCCCCKRSKCCFQDDDDDDDED